MSYKKEWITFLMWLLGGLLYIKHEMRQNHTIEKVDTPIIGDTLHCNYIPLVALAKCLDRQARAVLLRLPVDSSLARQTNVQRNIPAIGPQVKNRSVKEREEFFTLWQASDQKQHLLTAERILAANAEGA
jgi:hypothetical protein